MELLSMVLVWAFALYGSVLHGDFLYDDLPGIQSNEKIWKGEWKRFRWYQWRTLPQLSMALQVFLHGPVKQGDPIPQTLSFSLHALNVILHALTACVAGSIVGIAHPELRTIAALLWVAMPVAVAATAYMSSRAALCATLFGLSALWCVLSDMPWFAVPLIVLSVASKEDHAALPFGLAAAALTTKHPEWAALFTVAPIVFAILCRGKLKRLIGVAHSQKIVDAGVPLPIPTEGRRLTILTELIIRFPQWVCGQALCAAPAFKRPDWKRIATAVAFAAVALAAALVLPEARLPLMLVLTSPLPLYLVFSQVRDAVMDYRAYSAMIGPLLLLVPILPLEFLIAILVSWSVYSAWRILHWRTPMGLWKLTVLDGGGPVAWINLGAAHQMRAEFKEARHYFSECLKLYPETGVALLNLALIEGMEGKPEAARDKAEECVRLNPRYAPAWDILRQIYEFLKDAPNAERCMAEIRGLQ